MAKEHTNPGELSLEDQLKALELEERKQSLESKKIHDELARMQLSGLKQELETKTSNKKRGVEDAKKANEARESIRARCNHHTGGAGAEAIAFGQGDEDRPTCIGAQVMLDERIRLTCGRCNDVCWSDDPDRQRWQKWVGLWKHSINKQMMVVGGLKVQKQTQLVA